MKLYLSIGLPHLWLRSTHESRSPSVLLLPPWLFVILSELLGTSLSHVLLFIGGWLPTEASLHAPLLLFLPHLLRISLALLSRAFCWHFEILYLRSWGKKNWSLKHGTIRFYGWDKSVCVFILDNPASKRHNCKTSQIGKCLGGAGNLFYQWPHLLIIFPQHLRIWKWLTKVLRTDSEEFAFTHSLKCTFRMISTFCSVSVIIPGCVTAWQEWHG